MCIFDTSPTTQQTDKVRSWSVNYKDNNAAERIAIYTEKLIRETKKDYGNISMVCIGSDMSTGDSFAPIIGLILKKSNPNVKIYGDIIIPIHAKNLHDTIQIIDNDNTLIIAIDAMLCKNRSEIGNITVRKGHINPGSGVWKKLQYVGDISIAGCVNMSVKGFEYLKLPNTRLSLVYQMVCQAVQGISRALKNTEKTTVVTI